MNMSRLSILAAMSSNHVIGINNTLPWYLPPDLAHFKKLTMGHTIVMGRKTFESIGKPLPGRRNVIVTRQNNYTVDGAIVVNSVNAIIQLLTDSKQAAKQGFIIGGAELFKQTICLCQRMYLTKIQQDFPGDTFFPEFDTEAWTEITREKHLSKDKLAYHFVVLHRKNYQHRLINQPQSKDLGT